MNDTTNGSQQPGAGGTPEALAPKPLMPRRFYKDVSIEDTPAGWRVLLDGRVARTPRKRELVVPSRRLAQAIAEEWESQGECLDRATMPLTKLANTALDAVVGHEPVVRAEIAKYAGSDMLCYRADAPEGLARRQADLWDPLLAWSADELKAAFVVTGGLTYVAQPEPALDAVSRSLGGFDAFDLTSLHVLTTLTGSCLLSLAHFKGHLGEDEMWKAAHVDEDWQIERWGEDTEAMTRRAKRRAELAAACRLLTLLR
jgi:chaperone required for assembly of F1-ATPase